MMAFGKKRPPQAPQEPPTVEELIVAHRRIAQAHLDRAAKAGRLDAETRHATLGTGHAVMALSYQMDLLSRRFEVATAPPPDVDEDGYEPIEPI